ncbi:hypothetical protein [Campylobacter sp. US33a]|uniref:hypothetical protein n=1 Tax=Campylobacter sp. US33a TaxID=2498120 RepID=UPI00106852F9|nr:hypothetical protein [Campylobacter sp. US33a]TEY01595.1 hypothetical protein ELQ16_07455 [Campylobacter sp. US33a]
MKTLGFKFVGALALAAFLGGCGGAQKPSLETKQDGTLILIPKEDTIVKDIIVNNGECQAKRYAFNIDKSWEMAMERMDPQTKTLMNVMMLDKREMIENTGLGKDYNESIYAQTEYNQVQASKKFNDLVKKCYDATFPKAVVSNQVAKFDTNCLKITKVEIITEDDSFVYEINK